MKDLKDQLRGQFDPEKLCELYRAIDRLTKAALQQQLK